MIFFVSEGRNLYILHKVCIILINKENLTLQKQLYRATEENDLSYKFKVQFQKS